MARKKKTKKKRGGAFFKGKKSKTIAIAALIGVGAWMLMGAKKAPSRLLAMFPVAVKAGQEYSIQSYRVIAERRAGMQYDPVTAGGAGAQLTFTPSISGMFTRNVVREGGELWAEIH